jgi:hypothetical protein
MVVVNSNWHGNAVVSVRESRRLGRLPDHPFLPAPLPAAMPHLRLVWVQSMLSRFRIHVLPVHDGQ